MDANMELKPIKIFMYKGSIIRVYYNEFEVWRKDVKIAGFPYNISKDLFKQVKEALEM